jgi:autotransporter-associated beta strand protein
MATIKWAVTTDGTFDFNDPANWQFGTVPGAFDIAQFDLNATDTVTGNATVAEFLVTQGGIDLTGSYTISGAQPTELAIDGAFAALLIDTGASISGTGNIVGTNGGALIIAGTLSGSSASFTTGSELILEPGSVFDVGSVNLTDALIAGPGVSATTTTGPIQITGSVSNTGTELLVAGAISGTGSISVDDPVELDGSNTYSGGTTVGLFGQLAIGNANALGTGGLTIGSSLGATLLGMATETITNPLTVNFSATIAAAHGQTFTLVPSSLAWNANTGDVVTFGAAGQDGTVAFGSAAGIVNHPSTYTIVVQDGTLRPTDSELGIILSADQHTTIEATGTLDAAGFNLTVNDLRGGGQIINSGGGANLTVNAGNFGGVIGGPLSLIVNGALTLSGNNTFTGATTINGGSTLTLGGGGPAGSVPGAIVDNGALAINRSDNFVVNTATGSGQLQQIGPGNTWLGTDLSYTGGTLISAGTLIVNDPTALGSGGLTITGGELAAGLTEAISNQLTMSGNFTIAAAHGQTLTTSTTHPWTLNASGQTVTFGALGQDGTVLWSTPGGSLVTPFGGAYTVLVRAGTLRANDSSFGVLTQFAQQTIIRPAGTLDLAGVSAVVTGLAGGGHVTDSGAAALLQVNGGNFSGVIAGLLSLQVTNGSLTLSGNSTYTGTTTINSGTNLTLGAGGATGSVPDAITDNGTLATNRSDNFVVNNVSGGGQLQQIGPGVTTLGTGLSYSGGTTVSAGTLVVNDPAALGPGGLAISGGELLAGVTEAIPNALTLSGSFTIAAAHGQLVAIPDGPWTYSATAGAVIAFGAAGQDGTLLWSSNGGTIFNASLGYTVLVQAGTLLAAGSGFGGLTASASRTAIRPAATLDAAGFGFTLHDLRGGGHLTDSGAGVTVFVNGGNFGGLIDGALTLDVTAGGALTLTGSNNAYTGGTVIDFGGTLTLGDGGTTGSVPGAINDHGTLQFRHSGTFIEGGVISGPGNVVQSGLGTTVLTASNTYSGGTFLAGGTLEAQTPGALGSGAVTFLAGAPEVLRIDGTTMPGNTILNFAAGDTIDLANIAADAWSYGGFELTLLHGGFIVAMLNLSTPFGAHPLFALSGDGGGGTNIVLEPPPPQDLNADHLADLVFQTPNNAFVGALSTSGGFTAPQLWVQHGGSFVPGEAQYADLNNDHRVDLIFQGLDNRFYVSLSTGSAFTVPVQWVQHGGSFVAGQAQYADVNADGRADLIFQSNDNGFYVSLSTGGGFTAPAPWMQHGGSFTPGQAQYADVNGDGRADLIFQSNDNRFFVSTSTGSSFTAPVQWMQHGGSFIAGEAQYVDVNRDGLADLIFQSNDNRFFVSTSNGSGFAAPVQWMQHGGSFVAGEAQYADVNGDGVPDLTFQSFDNRFLVSLASPGTSGFGAPVEWGQFSGSFTPGQAQYADINGDGRYDLLFQANDNKEYLSLSNGANFGAASVVANFGAYGPFQPGTLHV